MPDDDAPQSGQPRSFWSGSIAFGLVNVPVSLFVAQRPRRVRLRIVSKNGTPLRRRYYCAADEELLDADEIVRGYEVEKDRYVVVEDEELEAVAPEKSREIDLKRFVNRAAVDPVYFERAYFLAPDERAVKAYRLLASTLEKTGRTGIASFVMRGKEYLVAIIAERGILRAETMRFHDEVRTPADIGLPELESADNTRARHIAAASRKLRSKKLKQRVLVDDWARRVEELVTRKLDEGRDVVNLPEAEEYAEDEGAEVIDLMAVMRERLGVAGSGSGGQDLAELPKNALYERAKELDIAGRSSMSKSELVAAIRKARK